jgi:hypothetical protein
MKRQLQYAIDEEQFSRDALELKYGRPANMCESACGPETGERTIFLFQITDPEGTQAYAWARPRRSEPWVPEFITVVKTETIDSFEAAFQSKPE